MLFGWVEFCGLKLAALSEGGIYREAKGKTMYIILKYKCATGIALEFLR